MNASLALVAAGHARDPSAPLRASLRQGVEQARQALESGAARDRLRALVEFSNRPREQSA